ncbi:MAG: hypothetical protein WC052_00580 [Patescibacteria group bacterium]
MNRRFIALAVLVASLTISFVGTVAKAEEPKFKVPDLTFKIVDFSAIGAPTACSDISNPTQRCIGIPWIGEYIASLYILAVSAATLLAAIVLLVSGFIWLTAAGNTNRISLAQTYAGGAVIGLVLMLGSYVILYTVNPQLTKFTALNLAYIANVPLEQKAIIDAAQFCSWRDLEKFPAGSEQCPGAAYANFSSCPQPQPTEGTNVCCCTKVTLGEDTFSDLPIASDQGAHATKQLAELMSCIKSNVDVTFNSISDDNIAKGTCTPWDPNETYSSSTNCQHHRGSKHYGELSSGSLPSGFSCAVDIRARTFEDFDRIRDIIVAKCPNIGGGYEPPLWETKPPHMHIEMNDCTATK